MYGMGEYEHEGDIIFGADIEEDGIGLRPIRGRRGRIIGEEVVVNEPGTLGDLDALRELREQLTERENRNPLREEDHTIEVEDEDLDILD